MDSAHALDAARAGLRLRLLGTALAATLLALAPSADRSIAAAGLLGYALVAVALRFVGARVPSATLTLAGIAADLALASTLVLGLPRSEPAWALYAIAIAAGALAYGVHGAAATTALAVVAYDVALALSPEASALDLWPVQVLLAFGVLATELVWAIERATAERRVLRAHALALRELAACGTADELLARLVEHAVRTFGARAAWIEIANAAGQPVVRHARGRLADEQVASPELAVDVERDPRTRLLAAYDPGGSAALRAGLADLAADAAATIGRIHERERLATRVSELDASVAGLRENLRERDDAVASAVHELRTPLTSVQAYGQMMSRNLQAVQRQVGQLERLIGDLLRTQGGPMTLELAPVDLRREVREAAARVRMVASAEVEIDADDRADYVVRADAGRLVQVLDNLLRNAAKFSPAGEPIVVALHRAGEEVLVSVSDRGAGIPAEELPHVFERYYRGKGQQRSVPGEGIGLAVSREIVAAHGGRITATSGGAGRGSTFTIALPAVAAVEAAFARAVDSP